MSRILISVTKGIHMINNKIGLFKLHKILSTLLYLLLIISILSLTISSSFAEYVNPNLNYYNENPFEVDSYNITEIVEKALERGYAIRNETYPGGCKNTTPEGGCKGGDWISPIYTYIRTNDSQSLLSEKKQLYINYPNQLAQIKVYGDIEFAYSGRVGFRSDSPNMTTEKASEIIVDELKALGILNRDIKINFHSFYPPELAGGQGNPGDLGILSYLIGIIILIFAMILIIQKYGGGKK